MCLLTSTLAQQLWQHDLPSRDLQDLVSELVAGPVVALDLVAEGGHLALQDELFESRCASHRAYEQQMRFPAGLQAEGLLHDVHDYIYSMLARSDFTSVCPPTQSWHDVSSSVFMQQQQLS